MQQRKSYTILFDVAVFVCVVRSSTYIFSKFKLIKEIHMINKLKKHNVNSLKRDTNDIMKGEEE